MRAPHSLALIASLTVGHILSAPAARAFEVTLAARMPEVSLDTLHQIGENDRDPSGTRIDEILTNFLVEKHGIWYQLSDELQLSDRGDTVVSDDEIHKLEAYVGWYSTLAKAFSRRTITFDQLQTLVAHYQEIQVARSLLNIDEAENGQKKNSNLWTLISSQEKTVLKEFQSRNLHRMRGEAIEMLLEGDPDQRSTLRHALRNLSPTIAGSVREPLPHVPEEFQWLWGLGDLMMESGDMIQHVSPSENSRGRSVDALFGIYLDHYHRAVNSLVKRRDSRDDLGARSFNNHSLKWIYASLLSPLSHMASLRESAPESSVRAEALLVDFRERTQSPTLAERSGMLLEQMRATRDASCVDLVRQAGGVRGPGDLSE